MNVVAANRDKWMRRVLWLASVFNLGGAMLLAFPAAPLGRLAGFPPNVPGIYCALLSFLVALFGASYVWLALQPIIHKPLVVLTAVGKVGVFVIVAAFWLVGAAPGSGVVVASGDLALGSYFIWWLIASDRVR